MAVDSIFRWVWRVNGLIILLGSLAIAAVILFGFLSGFKRNAPEPLVSSVASDPEGSEKWVLGRSITVNGSVFIYIPLESENKNLDLKSRDSSSEFNMYSGGGGYRRTYSKNVLFINTKTDEMSWLFEGVKQIITSIDQLPKDYQDSKVTKYITYSVIDTDTNGDGDINKEDNSSLAFSQNDGTAYQVILTDYERIISEILHENDIFTVVYQKSGVGYSARYSLNPFKLIKRTELPKVE